MTIREIIRLLEHDGWYLVATAGSHRQYRYPTKTGRVTVAGKRGHALPNGKHSPMHRYLIVIEPSGDNFAAYVPDLPGCVATGDTREETERHMAEAIRLHLWGMREDGTPIPDGGTTSGYVTV